VVLVVKGFVVNGLPLPTNIPDIGASYHCTVPVAQVALRVAVVLVQMDASAVPVGAVQDAVGAVIVTVLVQVVPPPKSQVAVNVEGSEATKTMPSMIGALVASVHETVPLEQPV
jgi:hypothetical protein